MSHRGMPKTRVIRERLKKEAEQRQEEYNALTLEQKLAKLPASPAAARQRAKLEAMLNSPQSSEVKEAKPTRKKKAKQEEE